MIQLTIAWTCVGIFIATAVITLLAMTRVIVLADKKYLDRLVKVLIAEVCVACIAVFTGGIELPGTVEERVEGTGREKAWKVIEPKIEALNQQIATREAKVQQYLKLVPRDKIAPGDRELLDRPVRLDTKSLGQLRGR